MDEASRRVRVGFAGLGTVLVAGLLGVACDARPTAPRQPPRAGERPARPRSPCDAAVAEGQEHAAAARFDRAAEALSHALLACAEPRVQRSTRTALIAVLDRWVAAAETAGDPERRRFLREALLTLDATPARRVALLDALLASGRIGAAQRVLAALAGAAETAPGSPRRRELERLEHQARTVERLEPGVRSAAVQAVERARAELIAGRPADAEARLRAVEPGAPLPEVLLVLGEALHQSGKAKAARATWARALGALEEGQTSDATSLEPRIAVSGGRDVTPEVGADGQSYALATEGGITAWDLATGTPVAAPEHRPRAWEKGNQLEALDPRGQVLATAGEDGKVKLWTWPARKLVRTLGVHAGSVASGCSGCGTLKHQHTPHEVSGLAFDPAGRYLASSSRAGGMNFGVGQVKVWALPSGALLHTLEVEDHVSSVAIDSRAGLVAAGTRMSTLRVWDLASGKDLRTLETHAGCGCGGSGYHSEGAHTPVSLGIDPGGAFVTAGLEDGRVLTFAQPSGRLLQVQAGHGSRVTSLTIGARGDYLAWGTSHGRVKAWSLASGAQIRTLDQADFSSGVSHVSLDPRGRGFVAAASGTLRIWSLPSGRLLKDIEHGHYYGATQFAAIDPEGRYLVSGGGERKARVWTLPSGQLVQTLNAQGFAGDGNSRADAVAAQHLATGQQGGEIDLWSLASGRRMRTLGGRRSRHRHWVIAVAMDPQGRFVVSGSRDSLAKVWSRATGELLHNLYGHTGDVTAVAIDPGARVVATGGADRTVKVWALQSARLLHSLTGHTGTVRALAFDPEGRHLASGGDDGSVRIWALPSGQLQATLVATDGGEWGVLTPDGYVDGSHRGLGLTRFGPGGTRSRLLGLLRQAVPGLLGRVLRGEGDFRLPALRRLLAREGRP